MYVFNMMLQLRNTKENKIITYLKISVQRYTLLSQFRNGIQCSADSNHSILLCFFICRLWLPLIDTESHHVNTIKTCVTEYILFERIIVKTNCVVYKSDLSMESWVNEQQTKLRNENEFGTDIYQGKGREDDRKQDGNMRVNDT